MGWVIDMSCEQYFSRIQIAMVRCAPPVGRRLSPSCASAVASSLTAGSHLFFLPRRAAAAAGHPATGAVLRLPRKNETTEWQWLASGLTFYLPHASSPAPQK